jgi:probable phosphomutase (TIGR03848 family)
MPVILLIRHGENDYVKKHRLAGRLPGVHLNQKGQEQARLLAEKLADAPIKAVYSSPLERTMETAAPLAQALGLEVIQRPGLIETDFGEWQGESLKKLNRLKIWRVVQNRPSLMRFPGGETFAELQMRYVRELEYICSQHEPKDILALVSHADPIRLAVAFYIGLPLDMFQRLSVGPGSISVLWLAEDSSRLLTLNYDPAFSLPKP